MNDAPPAFAGHGTPNYRAYALFALTVVYTFNFVDRGMISVTQEALKKDLGISDFDLGLLGGPAFAILYTLLGVPIARLAESKNRITIVAVGAAVWSVMTAACGAAANFMQLLTARVGVGIGEAACVPPSQSIIGDYYPSNRRATAIGIYSLGIPFGSMIAAIAGGIIVQHFGWRAAFLALGLPCLLAALLLKVTVREPPRSGLAAKPPSFAATIKILAGKKSFWHMAAAGALMSFVGYGTAQFLVSYSMRNYGVSNQEASFALGIVAGFAVALGTFAGGFLTDRLQRRFPAVACWLPGVGIMIALPVYLVAFQSPTFYEAVSFLLVAPIFHYMYLGPMYAVTQSVVQPGMRATAIALLLLVVNLIGYGLGPPLLGAMSDFLTNQQLAPLHIAPEACRVPDANLPAACKLPLAHGLRYAMMAVVALLAWPMIHFFLAARTYVRDRVS
jgi:MFS family permease